MYVNCSVSPFSNARQSACAILCTRMYGQRRRRRRRRMHTCVLIRFMFLFLCVVLLLHSSFLVSFCFLFYFSFVFFSFYFSRIPAKFYVSPDSVWFDCVPSSSRECTYVVCVFAESEAASHNRISSITWTAIFWTVRCVSLHSVTLIPVPMGII